MSTKEKLSKFLEIIRQSVNRMKEYNSRDIILLHHNDSDGLASAAILLKALQREKYHIKLFSLEKPYPCVLKKLFTCNSGKIILLADFAGMIASEISSLNNSKNLVIILDHHKAKEFNDNSIINLNPDFFQLKGDRDISASCICYFFAKELNTINKDLAHIAAFGAIADFYYIDKNLHSCNKLCLKEGIKTGLIRSEKINDKEHFFITLGKKEVNILNFYPMIDITGGVAYYNRGSEFGISIFLNGLTNEDILKINKLKKIKNHLFRAEIKKLKENKLYNTKNILWFDAKNQFSPMGVKMIGVFLEEIVNTNNIDPDKYIAGFMHIPDHVPGFGKILHGQTKISIRSSHDLSLKIRNGKMPGINEFLPAAAKNLGGFADACHSLSAAATINAGEENELINEVQRILDQII